MKEILKKIGMMAGLFILMFMLQTESKAEVKDFVITQDSWNQFEVMAGDTGYFRPQTENLTDWTGQPVQVCSWTYQSYDSEVVSLGMDGSYQALKRGSCDLCINGYSESGVMVFSANFTVQVNVDMTNVTLAKNSMTGYTCGGSSYSEKIQVISPYIFNEDDSEFTYTSSNSDMYLSCSLENNVITIQGSSAGKTVLHVVINGKTFDISVSITAIEINKAGHVGAKGKKLQLKVKGVREKISWSSSNSKVAKVSAKGLVRLKKPGNAVITAKIGTNRVGCAVSVVTPKMLKVINRAKYIGRNWVYSQPKRMENGYYDCSALVWKAYSKIGKKFGMSNYAPVAADLAKWCKQHGKVLTKAYTRQDIQKMKFRPGDLMFETGADNGRYKGIYHVEMFVGYTLSYYDESGHPVLYECWGARPDGYYGGGYLMERP